VVNEAVFKREVIKTRARCFQRGKAILPLSNSTSAPSSIGSQRISLMDRKISAKRLPTGFVRGIAKGVAV